MKDLLSDHIWALVICFLIAVVAYVVLALGGQAQSGTLLRAVIIALGSAVAGYAGGKYSK